MPDLTNMSLEELDELRLELMEKRDAVVKELHTVAREYHKREEEAKAEQILESMTEPQRQAILRVASTEATTKVGTPGV